MQWHRTILTMFGVAALAACGDAAGPGNAPAADREQILAILDESGWFADTFGETGLVDAAVMTPGFNLSLAGSAADTVPLVRRWGRRHGAPVSRERTVHVTGDTATATVSLVFEGEFLLDRTDDGVANPTSKPLEHTVTQAATFVRRAAPDSLGRRWRLVRVTPREAVMTDPARRTVVIERVTVMKNGAVIGEITGSGVEIPLEGGLMGLALGDEIMVTAEVANATGHDNVPPTFVFLHLYHASPNARGWLRLPMTDNGDGTYTRGWTVRHAGRERISVDAIDSQTFATDTEDDYRANVWGVPYRIR